MEDNTLLPINSPPAERTAQALRELHDRARTALTAQRERMMQLETQLTHQLDTIAGTLAEQIAEQGGPADVAQQSLYEIEQLRAELAQTQSRWNTERDAWQAERAELVAADCNHTALLDQRQADLEARQQTLDGRAADLNHQDREQRLRQEQLDSSTAQLAAQQSQLTANEAANATAQTELAQLRSDLASREQTCQASETSLRVEQETLAADLASLQSKQLALNVERESLAAQLSSLASDSQAKDNELAARLVSAEQQLTTERTAWDRERSNVDEQRRLLAKERDDLSTALDAARLELASARKNSAAAEERDELRQKFDLALEDIQRLRGRVAELEQDLAERPAANQTDSVELVQLRAERDALAEQITKLEQKSASLEDPDTAQERADLQRRFELAVDDVRDLKKKNAQLESKLAELSATAVPVLAGGNNWEAMKKQMLASLEGEADDGDADRSHERATIESTIRITDEALTLKDREIADLKRRLAEGAITTTDENAAIQQLVDADEVIAEHRLRIAQIEKDMNDKLRAAEVEVSVERAKLAREKMRLAEWQAEIDAHRPPRDPDAAANSPPQPKRRWLSKLGLSGDEES